VFNEQQKVKTYCLSCFHVIKIFLKKLKKIILFYFKLIFFLFSVYFDVRMSKIIFKKYYFNIFSSKKIF
jgi:hypothetical protein